MQTRVLDRRGGERGERGGELTVTRREDARVTLLDEVQAADHLVAEEQWYD